MKTIETKVYTFNELSEDAKDKARAWFLEGGDIGQFAYNDTLEGAKTIGLDIDAIDDHKPNQGSFIDGALECAQAITREHGPDCETYKTAKSFLQSLDSLNAEYPEDADGERDSEYQEELEGIEAEFLASLLEDYRIMFNKDYEHQCSNEVVDDNIIANEYTFTEDGKRFG